MINPRTTAGVVLVWVAWRLSIAWKGPALRSVGEDLELISSMAVYGIKAKNELFYTRRGRDTSSACSVIMRIPFTLDVPNVQSGHLNVKGKVTQVGNSYSVIEVISITRSW